MLHDIMLNYIMHKEEVFDGRLSKVEALKR